MTLMVALVVLLSMWRIAACFAEYDDGPFVPFLVALVDTAPFVSLALAIAAFYQRHQPSRMAKSCLWAATSLLTVTACDLVFFSASFRSRLHAGSWTGSANISMKDDDSILDLRFPNDGEAVILLGSTNHTEIYRGTWQVSFDPYLARLKEVQFPGFGRADYLKGDRLRIRGNLSSSAGSHQVAAILRHVSMDFE
jgi:hypothetical protein